jgi:hypothetical protein
VWVRPRKLCRAFCPEDPGSSWPIKPCRTNLALGSGWPGTDVMILKIFSPKILAKKLAFFCSKLSYIMQKFNNYLHWFLRKAPIFFCRNCQKSHKIVIITSTPDWVNFGRLSDAGKVQGSMLWSQFSPIFPNFRRKNWRFLKYQCYDQLFSKFSFVLSQKRRFFRWIFRRKYFFNYNIGPRKSFPCAKVFRESKKSTPRANPQTGTFTTTTLTL